MMMKMFVRNYEEYSDRFGFFYLVADDAEAAAIAREFDPPLAADEWYLRDAEVGVGEED